MQFRHELKHEITPSDLLALRRRLGAVMEPDPHAVQGRYFIRSLYFDNLRDKALREKLDGVSVREKFRIRYYNRDTSLIRLEKKSKLGGLGYKESASLTAAQVRGILLGRTQWMRGADEPLIRELYTKMSLQGLRPKTIVDYVREPFLFAPGNVRVTLDYDIRTGVGCGGFLDPQCVTIPVPGDPIILEVKWDDFLPDIVRDLVQLEGRHTGAFSKYAACRGNGYTII